MNSVHLQHLAARHEGLRSMGHTLSALGDESTVLHVWNEHKGDRRHNPIIDADVLVGRNYLEAVNEHVREMGNPLINGANFCVYIVDQLCRIPYEFSVGIECEIVDIEADCFDDHYTES